MSGPCWNLGLLALGLSCVASALVPTCRGEGYPLCCTVDYRSPIPPEWLKKAGIQTVYISVGMPLKPDPATGRRGLDEKVKPQIEEFLRLYGRAGIKVLVESNFYTRPTEGTQCVDASGRSIAMGCLRNRGFLDAMAKDIRDMAEAFSAYGGFAGFLFDDGVQVRADCCYCETCKRLFKEQSGLAPPPFAPDDGPQRLDPNDPRLLWDAFHQDSYAGYLRTQAQAAGAFSDKLFLATIPADSYFYGRHLSLEVPPSETPLQSGARLQRMDRIQVKNWRLFQSFPFPLVTQDGSGRAHFGTGCHLTTPSPGIIVHTGGPLIESAGRQQFLSPAEIRRMMGTTIAEGADRICFWTSAKIMLSYPDGFDAIGAAAADADKAARLLEERKPFPARIGLIYSTTTEIVQQPWRKNTMERWRHLHAFEAMAYALTRRSLQFRVLLDNDLDEAALSSLNAIILTGVTHLTKPVAEMLERAAQGRLKVLTDRSCLPLQGAKVCEFDQDYWFNRQIKGYRQPAGLDHQAAEIRRTVLLELEPSDLQPAVVQSGSVFGKFFLGGNDSLLIFLVNWDTENECAARVEFSTPHAVTDEPSGAGLGNGKAVEVNLPPAGWRVIRCAARK